MNKRYVSVLLFILSLVILSSCALRSSVLRSGYDFSKIKKIAVLDFKSADFQPISGHMASDIYIKYLLHEGYNVIERIELDSILREHDIVFSGAMDPKQIKKIGKLTGVDAFVAGSVLQFVPEIYVYATGKIEFTAAQVGITARMIDVESGQVLWTGSNAYDGMNTQVASEYLIASLVRQMMSDFEDQIKQQTEKQNKPQ